MDLPTKPTPVAAHERVEAIDIVRGFALFGVFLANMHGYFRTSSLRYRLEEHPWPGLASKIVDLGVDVFIVGKFMSLFAFLFGVGLAVQMERADAKKARSYRFLLRRLGVLMLIAVAHVTLIWLGDILHLYAFLGLLFLPFLRRKPKTVVIWAASIFGLYFVASIVVAIVKVRAHAPPPSAEAFSEEKLAEVREELATALRIYGHGTWLEIARQRIKDFFITARSALPWGLHDLAMFLLGLYSYKVGIFHRPAEHRRLFKGVLVVGVLFGLAFGAMRILLADVVRRGELGWEFSWLFGLMFFVTAAFSLAYASGIMLALEGPSLRRILAPLAPLGRMALTNYLMQSLLATWIFYAYGLGLYDKISPAGEVPLVIGIYAAQIVASRAWLKRYRFGPAEWAWRSLTYGKMQPMRLQ